MQPVHRRHCQPTLQMPGTAMIRAVPDWLCNKAVNGPAHWAFSDAPAWTSGSPSWPKWDTCSSVCVWHWPIKHSNRYMAVSRFHFSGLHMLVAVFPVFRCKRDWYIAHSCVREIKHAWQCLRDGRRFWMVLKGKKLDFAWLYSRWETPKTTLVHFVWSPIRPHHLKIRLWFCLWHVLTCFDPLLAFF